MAVARCDFDECVCCSTPIRYRRVAVYGVVSKGSVPKDKGTRVPRKRKKKKGYKGTLGTE